MSSRTNAHKAIAASLVSVALVAIPFVSLGRRLSAGRAPRSYRFAT